MKIILETERLILREMDASDLEKMFELDSNPLVHTYLGNKPIHSRDEARGYINSLINQYRENGIGRWATIEKETGNFIGWSGLKYITGSKNLQSNFHDVGYRFLPKFWGKGYATEATHAALRYAFETMKLHEVIGTCHQENKASRRVLEKCGLQLKEQFISEGLPCYWLSITKEDYFQ